MAKVEFVPVTPEGLNHIADNMRDADAAEVWASNRFTPRGALRVSVKASDYNTMVLGDGEPIAVLGLRVHDILTGTGVPWLLGTEVAATKYRRYFLTQSKDIIGDMLTVCPKLFNYVHDENTVSIEWLKWLGFEMDDPQPYGCEGELFRKFYLEKNDV